MQIARSDVALASQRLSYRREESSISIRAWAGSRRPDFEGRGRPAAPVPLADSVELSDEARTCACRNREAPEDVGVSPEDGVKLALIRRILEKLTGRSFKLLRAKDLAPREGDAGAKVAQDIAKAERRARSATAPRGAGFGLEVDAVRTRTEVERTRFSASGAIETSDGRRVAFSVEFSLGRELVERSELHLRAGDAVLRDPLVINFEGTAAELTESKIAFDLDSDGALDQISFVGQGSGFLALDLDGDGRIGDGRELFGARTGDGFAELAAYDADGNGWIDEADPVFDRLQVWSRDAGGQDRLQSLREADVGALYLRAVATPFELHGGDQSLEGAVRTSGIFLRESEGAGTVQQIDLKV